MARNKLLKYDDKTDYIAIRDQAALDGDFELAGEAETLYNRQIDETGSNKQKAYDFIKSPVEQSKNNQHAQNNPLGAVDFMNNYNVQKPTYNDTYGKQLDDALDKALNRKEFSYDVASDPLYQQLAKMYKREGNRAMEDTLAQAAINAGGMNSYAIGAAQQAANYYNSQLSDKIPELERLAYEMYLQDNEQDLRDFGILQGLQTAEYNKFRNDLSDFYTERNNQYGAFVDDYNAKAKADATRLENERYDQETALKNERYAAETALENERYDRETAKEDIWNLIALGINPTDAELIARSGMNQNDISRAAGEVQRQNYEKYKSEDEGYYVDDALYEMLGITPEEAEGASPTPAATAYDTSAYEDVVANYISSQYGNAEDITEEQAEEAARLYENTMNLLSKDWQVAKDTANHGWWFTDKGLDNNDQVKYVGADGRGVYMTISELYKELSKGMGADAAKKWLKNLQKDLEID